MRILIFLSLFILLPGCAHLDANPENLDLYTGVNFTPTTGSHDEVSMNGPLGVLGVSYRTNDYTRVYCEHQSSLSDAERGYGLNGCGFKIDLN